MIPWPPTALTNDVRNLREFTNGIYHVGTGVWRISIIGVFLSLYRKGQSAFLKVSDGAIVSGIE
jgi:uncharacterized membrane protein